MRILRHYGYLQAQGPNRDLAQRASVESDIARRWIEQAHHETHNRAFTCTAWSKEYGEKARLKPYVHTAQHRLPARLVVRIFKPHVAKLNHTCRTAHLNGIRGIRDKRVVIEQREQALAAGQASSGRF